MHMFPFILLSIKEEQMKMADRRRKAMVENQYLLRRMEVLQSYDRPRPGNTWYIKDYLIIDFSRFDITEMINEQITF